MWVALLSLILVFLPSWAEGHSREITQCKGNIVYKKAVLVEPPKILSSNGLVAEGYDTNDDGKPDVITLSHPNERGGHNEHPVFWIVDFDHDGDADAVYIDKRGLGKCTDIVLYQDLTRPLGITINPSKGFQHDQGGKL